MTDPEPRSPADASLPAATFGSGAAPDHSAASAPLHERTLLAVEAYLDGSLDRTGADLLSGLLRAGGADAHAIRARLSFAGLLGQAVDHAQGQDVVRAVNERIDALGASSDFERRVVRALPARRPARRGRPRSSWQGLATAALIVIVVGAVAAAVVAVTIGAVPAINRCRISTGAANAVLEYAGSRHAAADQEWLRAGSDVIASGAMSVRYVDGTTLTLSAGTRLTVAADLAGKHLWVHTGVVEAEVAPQPRAAPCILTTPDGAVAVVGTRFVLSASARGTRVDLSQGTVQLTRTNDGRTLVLHAGETAQIATDADFAVHPLLPHAATPITAAAAEVPLFPSADLDGWYQQHGSWINADGVVRSSGEGGPARLLSQVAYGDLVLTCRLRIQGVDHAEIQVGDYNWFVTVPAGSHDWIPVRVEQRAGLLQGTAGGAVLTPEPGAGRGPRPGPLAFYVMTGTLEIADARIRVTP